jgi:hypothetical protein
MNRSLRILGWIPGVASMVSVGSVNDWKQDFADLRTCQPNLPPQTKPGEIAAGGWQIHPPLSTRITTERSDSYSKSASIGR